MANPWFVKPEAVTINLTWVDHEGVARDFWIKIKKHLTVGEQRVVQTAGWRGVTGLQQGGDGGDAEIRIDWKATSFARAQAYLVDWSLEDDKHNRVPLTVHSLQALDEDVFALIEDAITEHVKAMDAEKKAKASQSEPAPTSA